MRDNSENLPDENTENGDSLDFTENALLEELQNLFLEQAEGDKDAITVREIAEIFGTYRQRVQNCLRILKDRGMIEAVKVRREAISGAWLSAPGYRLKIPSSVLPPAEERANATFGGTFSLNGEEEERREEEEDDNYEVG